MVVFNRPNIYLGNQSFEGKKPKINGKKIEVSSDMPSIYLDIRENKYTPSELLVAIRKEKNSNPTPNRLAYLKRLEGVIKEKYKSN